MEDHHVAGRANSSVTVRIPGNDHRELSDKQFDWRKPMLENPNRKPAITIAARVQGYIEANEYLVRELLADIPDELCELSELDDENSRPE
jgi:hypothetical protein